MSNFLKNNWWKFLVGIIFTWFCYSCVVSLTMPDKDRFIVLDKIEQMATKSTGKYSSELVLRTFVKVQYENGDVETLNIDDPFVSRNYVVNEKYVVTKNHLSLYDYNIYAFYGRLIGLMTFGVCIFALWIYMLERDFQKFSEQLKNGNY